MAAETDYT